MVEQLSLPVRDGEDPWTPAEIALQREELVGEISAMERRIAVAEAEIAALMSEGPDGAGRDAADVGSSAFERDHEMSLAYGARKVLEQSKLALELFDKGEYGRCETCGQPIGKGRLQVFPRATACLECKRREERR